MTPGTDRPHWPVSRFSALVSVAALSIAAAMPAQGLGFTVCWFRHLTGIPCPGCGIMRSLASILHGQFATAVRFHPLGPLVFLAFLAIALGAALPASWRSRLAAWAEPRRAAIHAAYGMGVAVFLGFGFIRMAFTAGERLAFLALN